MKSNRIIFILFSSICLCLQTNAFNDSKTVFFDTYHQESQLDSVYSVINLDSLHIEQAKIVTNLYQIKIGIGDELSNEDLKNLAISYAYLNNDKKASEYTLAYIKKAHDINILNDNSFENIKNSASFNAIVKKYYPQLDGWIIVFFSAGLIGIFIAVVLNLGKEGDVKANILISLFVLFHSFFIIHLCLFLSKYNFTFPHSLYITTSFSFLYGPLLYFYFKRVSEGYKFKYTDLLHLIPSVALFLYFLPIYILPASEKLELLLNRDEVLHSTLITVVILKYLSLIIYAFLVYKIYLKKVNKKSKLDEKILWWLKNIAALNVVYVISYIVYGVALMSIVGSNILIYPQIFSMAIIVLYVGYVAYVQPRVFFSNKYLFKELNFLKYKKSGLTKGLSSDLKEELLILLEEEKIYKSSSINLDTLSNKLGTTRHNISQVINEHFGMNFFHLINKYRVEEAQKILENGSKNLHIIDVAYDVGFNNKVTFNKAFKDNTQLTPTQYLEKLNSTSSGLSATA